MIGGSFTVKPKGCEYRLKKRAKNSRPRRGTKPRKVVSSTPSKQASKRTRFEAGFTPDDKEGNKGDSAKSANKADKKKAERRKDSEKRGKILKRKRGIKIRKILIKIRERMTESLP